MPKHSAAARLKGEIIQYNISPKGMYEGMLLKTPDGIKQVNFPKETSALIAGNHSVGEVIELQVEDFESDKKRKSDHKVHHLVSISNDKSPKKIFSGKLEGKVVALNYALHGEVNGAILESGDFVHLKPEGAEYIALEIGQKLAVEGEARPTSLPHLVIEAHKVNGRTLKHKK